jgi:mono/diheme cytochrome c family protein
MNKRILVLPVAVFSLIIGALIFQVPAAFGQAPSKAAAKGILIPDDLKVVFTNSCMPCHSDKGKEMAKIMLNFSKWNNYSWRTQVQKSRAICRMISKNEMPPAPFRESSPELALTKEQKDNICKWVNAKVVKK